MPPSPAARDDGVAAHRTTRSNRGPPGESGRGIGRVLVENAPIEGHGTCESDVVAHLPYTSEAWARLELLPHPRVSKQHRPRSA